MTDEAVGTEERPRTKVSEPAPLNFADSLARLSVIAEGATQMQAPLPCAPARAMRDAARDVDDEAGAMLAVYAGAGACSEARADATCSFRNAPWCPQREQAELYDTVNRNMAAGRVELDEAHHLRAHFRRSNRKPLDPRAFDAFAFVLALQRRKPCTVSTRAGDVVLRGDERLVLLYGPPGRGKTLAASYLIAKWGGVYMTGYELAAIGPDASIPSRAAISEAGVWVVDQLGRVGGSWDRAASNLEELVDARYRRRKLTVLIGNFESVAQFDKFVEPIIASRFKGGGVYVHCVGPDARKVAR